MPSPDRPRPGRGRRAAPRRAQRGATVVEFALVMGLLVACVVALVDVTRWCLALASTVEATRAGARIAAVCGLDEATVILRTRQRLQMVDAAPSVDVAVRYLPGGCTPDTCRGVQVAVQDATVAPIGPWSPLGGGPWRLPTRQAYLPREALSSRIDSQPNPICEP